MCCGNQTKKNLTELIRGVVAFYSCLTFWYDFEDDRSHFVCSGCSLTHMLCYLPNAVQVGDYWWPVSLFHGRCKCGKSDHVHVWLNVAMTIVSQHLFDASVVSRSFAACSLASFLEKYRGVGFCFTSPALEERVTTDMFHLFLLFVHVLMGLCITCTGGWIVVLVFSADWFRSMWLSLSDSWFYPASLTHHRHLQNRIPARLCLNFRI